MNVFRQRTAKESCILRCVTPRLRIRVYQQKKYHHVRWMTIEWAWGWLWSQPDSALSV